MREGEWSERVGRCARLLVRKMLMEARSTKRATPPPAKGLS